MRKSLLLSLTFVSLMLCFSACSSSDYDANPSVNNSNTRNPFQGEFTANINGSTFVADEKTFVDTTINGNHTISISAVAFSPDKSEKKSQTITLSILNYNGPHSYPIDGISSGLAQYIVKDTNFLAIYTVSPADPSAAINITNNSTKLEGTFNFIAVPTDTSVSKDTLFITNGEFSLPK